MKYCVVVQVANESILDFGLSVLNQVTGGIWYSTVVREPGIPNIHSTTLIAIYSRVPQTHQSYKDAFTYAKKLLS